jgi:leader peptidase (prepilin peptidase)/N-methyltransferase
MTWWVLTVAGAYGLVIGSFLNVVVWRVPRGTSIVSPPSACPACGHQIRRRDNIPVLSWLVLRGRCRDCSAPISTRYPLVEAFTGALFVLVVWWSGVQWTLPAYLYLAGIAVVLALIDLDTHRLPNSVVLPSYAVAAALLALASWAPGTSSGAWESMPRALIGAAAMFVFYAALMVVYPAGMGFGDVKLAGVLGLYLAWVGWGSLVVGFFAAFLLGGLFSIALLLTRRAGRRTGIPFGPWMLLGTALGIGWGQPLWVGYLALAS